jgi:hypothetical protein
MSAPIVAAPLLHAPLPRMACPSQVDIGDLVRLKDESLPVVITSGGIVDDHRVFTWASPIVTTAGLTVTEGRGVHDAGEQVMLLARGESVPAAEVRDGDLLILEGRTSLWGVVIGDPRADRRGVLDIAWRAGSLPSGMPATVGWLQREPQQIIRRAPKVGAR